MAKHWADPRSVERDESAVRRRRRAAVIFAACCAAAVIALGGVAAFQFMRPAVLKENTGTGGTARVEGLAGSQGAGGAGPDAGLPFALDGVPTDAPVVQVSEGADTAALRDAWSFGGDYSAIGSFPLDDGEVFGSSTDDPSDETGYAASVIGRKGARAIESASPADDEGFWEPQDGSAYKGGAVWRSAKISYTPQASVDNWRIQAWDGKSGAVETLMDASAINDGEDTPRAYGEVVPTANVSHAFFAGNVKEGSAWKTEVLAAPLDGSRGADDVTRVGEGNYPAAVEDGVLFASTLADADDPSSSSELKHWGDGDGKAVTVFTMSPANNGSRWGIDGVWAFKGYRAVCFTSTDIDDGSYIGIWSEGFQKAITWLHVDSPSVVASLNGSWLVWGSGSQGSNAGMYAFKWGTSRILYLGSASGYSRPTIASDSNTVLVPEYQGDDSAVSFTVGELPE